jgi:adenine-specific DNA-methyltransferase
MELHYKDKKNKQEIIDKALTLPKILDFNNDNLLIQGDNLIALSSLLSSHKGKIDLIYIDPPFNTNQVFTIDNNRVSTISRGNTGLVAYNDKLPFDQYLEFMRQRLIIMRELLSDKGSIYVHIDLKVGHYLKVILDEVFGSNNFLNDITRIKSNPKNFSRRAYGNEKDTIYFYAKNKEHNIWNNITKSEDRERLKKLFPKTDGKGDMYSTIPLHAPGETKDGNTGLPWRDILPPVGRHWRTDPKEFDRLDSLGLIEWSKTGNPRIKRYAKDHKGSKIQDIWSFKDPQYPTYPTEKNSSMLDLIIKQSSTIESIVLDCFSGSGSTLLSASKNSRQWIGIDSSEESINIIKTNLSKNKILYSFIDLRN